MTAEPCPPAPTDAAGRLDHDGRRDRLDQDVDRAAAGQPDVPRLLVADPVADDPGVAGRAGALDLLGRGALDAAAADRAGDPAVGRVQQDGALGPRGGAERPDDDGAADRRRRPVGLARSVSVSSSSFIAVASVRSGRWSHRRRRPGGATTARDAGVAAGSAAWAAASLPRRVSPARTPPRISPSRSSEATVPAGRKSSMYG